MRSLVLTVLAVPLALCTIGAQAKPTQPAAPPVNATGAGVQAFQERVKEWVAFHNKVDNGIPKQTETADPTKIAERERQLGEALVKARPNAVPGEYFVKEFQPVLTKIIQQDFKKRTAAERKALIVEIPKGTKFGINMIYPSTFPLATFPGNLLKALPDLPPELEYRIIYRHIILRDVTGNYVVDMVANVFPIPM